MPCARMLVLDARASWAERGVDAALMVVVLLALGLVRRLGLFCPGFELCPCSRAGPHLRYAEACRPLRARTARASACRNAVQRASFDTAAPTSSSVIAAANRVERRGRAECSTRFR